MYDFGNYGCLLPYQPVQKCQQVLQDEVYGFVDRIHTKVQE